VFNYVRLKLFGCIVAHHKTCTGKCLCDFTKVISSLFTLSCGLCNMLIWISWMSDLYSNSKLSKFKSMYFSNYLSMTFVMLSSSNRYDYFKFTHEGPLCGKMWTGLLCSSEGNYKPERDFWSAKKYKWMNEFLFWNNSEIEPKYNSSESTFLSNRYVIATGTWLCAVILCHEVVSADTMCWSIVHMCNIFVVSRESVCSLKSSNVFDGKANDKGMIENIVRFLSL